LERRRQAVDADAMGADTVRRGIRHDRMVGPIALQHAEAIRAD
jgi:hypothetical protein